MHDDPNLQLLEAAARTVELSRADVGFLGNRRQSPNPALDFSSGGTPTAELAADDSVRVAEEVRLPSSTHAGWRTT